MKEKIQIINNEKNNPLPNITFNKFDSPQSFDDYDINIIDISRPSTWYYYGSSPVRLNIEKDILSIADMIEVSSSNILLLLPQNVTYYYNYGKPTYSPHAIEKYQSKTELKNDISLFNSTIGKFLNRTFKDPIIMYNKTSTLIQDITISSDFVFSQKAMGEHITLANNGKSVTTLNYNDVYLTTVNLSDNNYINLNSFLKEIKWLSNQEEYPEWLYSEKLLDDEVLLANIEKLKTEKEIIETEIRENRSKINENLYYKSILYSTGDQLVDVVNHMLDEMVGYEFDKFVDKKEEDFCIEKEDCVFLGEIKGISSNVKRSNITQTAMHRDLYLEIEGNEHKNVLAIAIINRQRNKPLKEREVVPEDIKKVAKLHDVLLITSETFLKIYEKFRNGELKAEDIKELLLNQKGLLEL